LPEKSSDRRAAIVINDTTILALSSLVPQEAASARRQTRVGDSPRITNPQTCDMLCAIARVGLAQERNSGGPAGERKGEKQ